MDIRSFVLSFWGLLLILILFIITIVNYIFFINHLKTNEPKRLSKLLIQRMLIKTSFEFPLVMRVNPFDFVPYCTKLKEEKNKRIKIQKILFLVSSSLFFVLLTYRLILSYLLMLS